ncbi:hypothetical protein M9H77_06866 [Catharanthus roseus]|uniref:Uncharacterized protein n=1 Tax=Catharanthus roseus TaxID=4058 RepID=A0ACC0BTB3_CATRO|nr:hypothetical protein M9H77_06866 [Catharanthus roseus]
MDTPHSTPYTTGPSTVSLYDKLIIGIGSLSGTISLREYDGDGVAPLDPLRALLVYPSTWVFTPSIESRALIPPAIPPTLPLGQLRASRAIWSNTLCLNFCDLSYICLSRVNLRRKYDMENVSTNAQ